MIGRRQGGILAPMHSSARSTAGVVSWVIASCSLSACGASGAGEGTAPRPSSAVSAPAAASVVSSVSSATAASAMPSVTPPAFDWASLPRNDAPSEGLVVWDGAVVARTSELVRIDAKAGRAEPFTLPGCTRVVALSAGSPPAALCTSDAGVQVVLKSGDTLRAVPGPTALAPAAVGGLLLAVDGEGVVVLSGTTAFVHEGADYRRLEVTVPKTPATMGGPNHALLAGRTLYLGYDRGEWGGALVAVDLDAGSSRLLPGTTELELPVHDLLRAPDGRVHVVRGLAHLGLREGELAVIEAGTTRTLASTGQGDAGSHWALPPADFDALAFDAAGHAYLSSGALGVLRLDGERWVRLTPSWPDHVYLRGLAIVGDTVFVGTYDAGVVVWDVSTGKATRVPLPR